MTQRIGDYAASVPLLLPVAIAASIGGRNIDTGGFRAAQANIIVSEPAGGGGADTCIIKFQESAGPIVSDQINGYDGADDGNEQLRDGAASNILLGVPFTPTVTGTINSVRLMLSTFGTPAIAAGGIPYVQVSIQADAAGDPSGTDIGGYSRRIPTADLATALTEVSFWFDNAVDLTAASDYWIVVAGLYDVSATDCVQFHHNTVVGTSGCKHYDAAWSAADANIDYWYEIDYLVYTDIADIAAVTFTEGTILNVIDEGADREELGLQKYENFIRAYYTLTGGTWDVFHALTVGDPTVQPVV